ncbi:molybdate ABC transporter substrate-binding protein [Psychrobacter sp. FDAARGOS_221]|uniref:molybdate ABC transporter substrate-binding protein n=1 Tax=Psychrobacter sp. FDAARGOS_221 TaxID=1975705 RepID=UPI000BB56E10|nr:molybdate ABC transporter substrate-binding protein [Psychrobacter sp. FDAARGOS_221]PNK60517.1 molybdate ABC transporter substrate-binding protein [Psychrobacter sp. FDAARGOS_221]
MLVLLAKPNSSSRLKPKQHSAFAINLKSVAYITIMLLLASCSNDSQPSIKTTESQSQTKSTPSSDVLRIAAAANLAGVLPSIIEAYNHDEMAQREVAATKTEVTYASSGKLYAQINSGAPYDVFLSADQQYPAQYRQSHPSTKSDKQTFTYARGQLALYSDIQDLSSVSSLNQTSLQQLWLTDGMRTGKARHQALSKITLANPELAPYGASAKAFLQQTQLYEPLQQQKRLIQAENIGQAFQYTYTATTDYGFVALSQLVSAKINPAKYRILAADSYPPILQDGVVISDHPQAVRFAHYLQSAAAQMKFSEAGYLAINN